MATDLSLAKGTKANAIAFANELAEKYPRLVRIYGWRQDALEEHPSGRALDLMLPTDPRDGKGWDTPYGDIIAAYVIAHRDRIKLQHVIWNHRIWSTPRAREGWRYLSDRGSANNNHENHLHVWLKDEPFVPLSPPTGQWYVDVDVLNGRSKPSTKAPILWTRKRGYELSVTFVQYVEGRWWLSTGNQGAWYAAEMCRKG